MPLGAAYTFSDTVTPKQTITDFISIIDPDDIPLISYFGMKNQDKFGIQNFGNHTYTWLLDTLRPRTATLGEGLDTTETGVDVASGHGARFHVGDVWKLDETDELILVTAHDGTDTVTTVIRNWGAAQGGSQGTASSSVTTATGMTYLFTARREGADSSDSAWTVPTLGTGRSQIMHHEIKVTRSEMLAQRWGMPDRYRYELEKALGGGGGGNGRKGRAGYLMTDIENTFFWGQAVERTGSTVEGGMGGLREHVTAALYPSNVVNASSADLTEDHIQDLVQVLWGNGSRPNFLICNYFQKRQIARMFSGSIQTERSERTGGVLINTIETEGGTLDVLLSRRCQPGTIYIGERDLIGWVTLEDWFIHPLAINGDLAKRDEIIGEFGFVVKHPEAHGWIYGLSTS